MPDPGSLGLGALAGKVLSFLFRTPPDLEICKTRIMREKGYPWNDLVAVHRDKSGRLEVKLVKTDKG